MVWYRYVGGDGGGGGVRGVKTSGAGVLSQDPIDDDDGVCDCSVSDEKKRRGREGPPIIYGTRRRVCKK